MVIVIHQSSSTQNAMSYNEQKVEQKKLFSFKAKTHQPSIHLPGAKMTGGISLTILSK